MIDKQTKVRAYSLESVMKNKNLAKAIGDSWNSPVGSSKRDRAKSILRTVRKGHERAVGMSYYDGRGGGDINPFSPNALGQMNSAPKTATPAVTPPTPPASASFAPSSVPPAVPAKSVVVEGVEPVTKNAADIKWAPPGGRLSFAPTATSALANAKSADEWYNNLFDPEELNPFSADLPYGAAMMQLPVYGAAKIGSAVGSATAKVGNWALPI